MEQVTVTPQTKIDGDGNPVNPGPPVVLAAFAVAPGNTTATFTDTSNIDSADFTVYLPFGSPVHDDDTILVRGRTCTARVQEWRDPWPGEPLNGLVVVCRSTTGAT